MPSRRQAVAALCAGALAIAATWSAPGVLGGASGAAIAAPIPPDLASLEQQTVELQANSERFSFQEELAFGGGLFGQGVPLALIFAGTGEASDSPPQVSARGGLFGIPDEQTRLVGDAVYHYRTQAAEIDGGRPWVRSTGPASEESQPVDPGGLLESAQAGRQGTFTSLIEQLNGALSIEESGPVTIDGQRAIEFDATLDPGPFLAKLKSQSKEPVHPLRSPLEASPVSASKGSGRPAPAPTLELEVFIAANGLPVRARVTFTDEGATVAVRVDTLAINVPVHVTAPPASKTIEEAQLKRLERRRAQRERARALRACAHLHGKCAVRCRVLARSGGGSVSESLSL